MTSHARVIGRLVLILATIGGDAQSQTSSTGASPGTGVSPPPRQATGEISVRLWRGTEPAPDVQDCTVAAKRIGNEKSAFGQVVDKTLTIRDLEPGSYVISLFTDASASDCRSVTRDADVIAGATTVVDIDLGAAGRTKSLGELSQALDGLTTTITSESSRITEWAWIQAFNIVAFMVACAVIWHRTRRDRLVYDVHGSRSFTPRPFVHPNELRTRNVGVGVPAAYTNLDFDCQPIVPETLQLAATVNTLTTRIDKLQSVIDSLREEFSALHPSLSETVRSTHASPSRWFAEAPDERGNFAQNALSSERMPFSLYVIEQHRSQQAASFTLCDSQDAHQRALLNHKALLLPVCQYEELPRREHSRIIVNSPGRVERDANGWHLKQKINLTFA